MLSLSIAMAPTLKVLIGTVKKPVRALSAQAQSLFIVRQNLAED
jgi:hypothetical protein